jgi:hypothetical protein
MTHVDTLLVLVLLLAGLSNASPSSTPSTDPAVVFRVHFGSCVNLDREQIFWPFLASRQLTAPGSAHATTPFVWLGDIVYGDIGTIFLLLERPSVIHSVF